MLQEQMMRADPRWSGRHLSTRTGFTSDQSSARQVRLQATLTMYLHGNICLPSTCVGTGPCHLHVPGVNARGMPQVFFVSACRHVTYRTVHRMGQLTHYKYHCSIGRHMQVLVDCLGLPTLHAHAPSSNNVRTAGSGHLLRGFHCDS